MNLRNITLLLTSLVAASTLHAQGDYLPGDLIVMLAPGAKASAIATDLATYEGQATGMQVVKELSAPMRAWLLHFDPAAVAQHRMLHAMQAHPAVMLAQNNHVIQERVVPNDSDFGQQWQHVEPGDHDIDSDLAWDITTGGTTATGDEIVVCIVENADLPHEDLVANAWYNTQEVPNNGIDEDGNGYTDDYQGWNPGGNDDDVYGGGHGTSVAGIIGAVGDNNLGVAGANWNVKMMPVTYGALNDASVVESYTYPLVMRKLYNESGGNAGAFVVATNASWGIDNEDHNDHPIWCAVYDSLGAVGILNCGATANNAVDIDVVDDMPTGCESDFMVSVTATDDNDMRTFSAWGATTIDVGAPGDNIYTTEIGNGYGYTSGTSFASPLTAGVIGLLYSAPCASMMALVNADPMAGALYIRQALFNGVDQGGNLVGNTVTGGRINSFNSLSWIMANCGACPSPYGLAVNSSTPGEATFAWNSTGTGPYNVQYSEVGSGTWTSFSGVINTSLIVNGLDPCTEYEFQVEAICDTVSSGFSPSVILEIPLVDVPVISLSGDETFCIGGEVTLTASPAPGYQWNTSETAQSIVVNQSGPFTVTVNGPCNSATSDPVVVTVLPAPLPTSSDVNLPAAGVATLNATGDSILWYDTFPGGTPVGSGNSWDTPFLWSTTSFWCSNTTLYGGVISYGAFTNNTTSGQYHLNGNNWELFTAFEPFTIVSVKVYANGASNRQIGLVDMDAGTTVTQGSFAVPDGESRVDINFDVPAAGNYGLRIMSGTPNLWRDGPGSNPPYPFALGTMGTLTSSTVDEEYYYFFYDWEVRSTIYGCESELVEVVVSMPVGIGEVTDFNVAMNPDPADDEVTIQISGVSGPFSVLLLDNTGREVMRSPATNGTTTLSTSTLSEGLYVVSIRNDGGELHRSKLVVAH